MKKALLVIAVLFVISAPTFAQEAVDEGPRYTIFTKLGRGIGNVILSPIEIPVSIGTVGSQTDVFVGVTAGTVGGVCGGVERLCGGAVEILTFLFPPYDRPLVSYELGKSPAAQAAITTFPKPDEF
ncbi:exosortase system-associated protein, TIGR04073 family [bacterium]|nr:exosortase system-associated protein, TIGR04073 family [bacterium]